MSFLIDNTEIHATDSVGSGETQWKTLFIMYNASEQDVSITLPEVTTPDVSETHAHNRWTVLANGTQTNCRIPLQSEIKDIQIPQKSGIILGQE